jgi:uncharacterized protein RhaS with RHS repeats
MLYYYRARYYNPAPGRFVSEDPIGFSGGPNVYAYVSANPVQIVDSLGLAGTLRLQPYRIKDRFLSFSGFLDGLNKGLDCP